MARFQEIYPMPTHPDFPGCRIYTRARSPYYYLEYTCPLTGRPVRTSSGKTTETAAWEELAGRLYRLGQPSWKEAVVHFIEQRARDLKPTTLHQYENSIRALDPFLGDKLLDEIDQTLLKTFIHHRRQQVSDASVRRDLATGSTIFSTAQMSLPRPGVPKANPFRMLNKRHLKETKRRRYLTEAEYRRVEAALTEEWHRIVLDVFIYTGMRHREVRMMEKDWIKWEHGTYGEIQLPEEWAKNGEPRIIPLFPKLRRTLEDWCARHPGNYVFSHWSPSKQMHVPYTSFQGFWRRVRKRAGVEDVRIHDLRHTFASWWVQKGGDMAVLRSMLGHADMRMVERYAHLNSEAQHRAVGEVEDLI